MSDNIYVQTGKIVAPHGVRGEVRVVSMSEFDKETLEAKELYIKGLGSMAVEHARFHKQFMLIKFKGIDDMDKAGTLRNKDICLTREQIGELPEGRYYIEDLIGLKVYDTKGAFMGEIAEVLVPGANDVYVVRKEGEKDILLPVVEHVIISTDVKNGKIIADPPVWED